MSDLFLEQRMDIIFCVKLGKNATDNYTMLPEAYGGEAIKNSSVSLTSMVCLSLNSFHKFKQSTKLIMYVEISKRLREAVHRKRTHLWPYNRILHHDNAPAHKALSVKQFLAQK
jgi:hypothetical protein